MVNNDAGNDIAPVRPCARNVRARLREAGIEYLITKVSTGRHRCWVRLDAPPGDDTAAQRVAVALRELWHDGDLRVKVLYSGAVIVDVSGYWHTVPNTEAGLAQLAAKEAERTAALLQIVADGGRVSGPRYVSVSHEPHADHPHRPWVDRVGHRYSTFEVYPLRS